MNKKQFFALFIAAVVSAFLGGMLVVRLSLGEPAFAWQKFKKGQTIDEKTLFNDFKRRLLYDLRQELVTEHLRIVDYRGTTHANFRSTPDHAMLEIFGFSGDPTFKVYLDRREATLKLGMGQQRIELYSGNRHNINESDIFVVDVNRRRRISLSVRQQTPLLTFYTRSEGDPTIYFRTWTNSRIYAVLPKRETRARFAPIQRLPYPTYDQSRRRSTREYQEKSAVTEADITLVWSKIDELINRVNQLSELLSQ